MRNSVNNGKLLIAATVPETVKLLMRGQLNWFAKQGYVVEVCTDPGKSSGLGISDFVDEVSAVHQIPMQRDFSISRDVLALFRWVKLLRKSRPEYLVACTPKASLLALIAGFIARVPKRVYILFGLRYETATGLARAILRMTEKICSACAHIVIVVSPSLSKCAVDEGLIEQSKVRLVGIGSSNGVDSTRFTPMTAERRSELREKLGYLDSDFVVGFIGRLTPDKGIDTLLGALNRLNQESTQVKLLLIGPDEGSQVNNSWSNTVGPQPDTSLWHPLLDVLVLPTKREGFPNVVLEAHACAVPVITTRATGAIDSVVDNENGILIDVDNEEQLAEAVLRLRNDRQLGIAMGRNGRDWVVKNFQPESIWLGMDTLFKQM